MTTALTWTNLAAAFGVELAALAAFGIWGAHAVSPAPGRWGLAIAAPLTAAILWGLFCAPQASVPLPSPAVTAIKLALLATATLALAATDKPRWAAALTAAAITTTLLAHALPDPAKPSR